MSRECTNDLNVIWLEQAGYIELRCPRCGAAPLRFPLHPLNIDAASHVAVCLAEAHASHLSPPPAEHEPTPIPRGKR